MSSAPQESSGSDPHRASTSPPRSGSLSRHLRRGLASLLRGVDNALELLSEGGLGAPYRAPYEVIERGEAYALRRYTDPRSRDAARFVAPVLFVPPLMVTAEIYDISPELSAVARLVARGVDVWLCDFGTPEEIEGGLDRTLDDHILAISRCLDRVAAETGQDVHLIGYSQGGMFCYQTAALRRGAGVRSLVTFGAPVDMRRNIPRVVRDAISDHLLLAGWRALDGRLARLRALPGALSSWGFKLLAPGRELRQLIRTIGHLSDRDALLAAEPKRRFLGGEGFIAWPGPAFRTFVAEFVVYNRMKRGGLLVAGEHVSLADIEVPIAYFVGHEDTLARPASVAAIEQVAVRARCHRFEVRSGHFGLVIGTQALAVSWPSVLEWLAWIDGTGDEPAQLAARRRASAAASTRSEPSEDAP